MGMTWDCICSDFSMFPYSSTRIPQIRSFHISLPFLALAQLCPEPTFPSWRAGWKSEPFKWPIFQLVIKSCFGFLGYKISAAVRKAQYLIKDLLYHYTLRPGTRRNMLGGSMGWLISKAAPKIMPFRKEIVYIWDTTNLASLLKSQC